MEMEIRSKCIEIASRSKRERKLTVREFTNKYMRVSMEVRIKGDEKYTCQNK